MEPSSSSPVVSFSVNLKKKKKNAEEDIWSELCGLRRLYGLLKQTTDQKKQEEENLDNRSLLLLKKLLDDANHQAIQSKIMFDAPGGNSPPSAIEFLRGRVGIRPTMVMENKCMKPLSSSVRNLPLRRQEGRICRHYLNPTAMNSGSGFDRRNLDERFKIDIPLVNDGSDRVNAKEKWTFNRRRVDKPERKGRSFRLVSIVSKRSCRPSRHSSNTSRLRHGVSLKKPPSPSPSNSSSSSADSGSFSSPYSSLSSSSNSIRRIRRRQNSGRSSSRFQSFRQERTLPYHPTPPPKSLVKKPHRAADSGEGESKGGRKKEKGNIRGRIKEKLPFIFHHHHHHHHYKDEDDNKEEPPPEHSKHVGSRKISNKGRLVEFSGKREVEKAHDHGYLHMLVDSLISHLWHSSKNKEERQRNTKIPKKQKNTKLVKKKKKKVVDGCRKLPWWQVWKKHGGVNLNSRGRKKKNLKFGLNIKKR